MRMEVDREADTAYIYLKEDIKQGEVKRTVSISEGINLDFDKHDVLVGIEIIRASKHIPKKLMSKEVPA